MIQKFDVSVVEQTLAESALLHQDVPGYDLPGMDFVDPPEGESEGVILEEDDPSIYVDILVHMVNDQRKTIFKSDKDFKKNMKDFKQYLQYAENWQTTSVLCSYGAAICDVILIISFIFFVCKYKQMMQAILTAFLSTHKAWVKAALMTHTFPPLFTINLPDEDEFIDEFKDIVGMQTMSYAISIIVIVIVILIIVYQIGKRCHYTRSMIKACFSFVPSLRILRTSIHTDLFLEITNLTKGNTIWAHFTSTGCIAHSQLGLGLLGVGKGKESARNLVLYPQRNKGLRIKYAFAYTLTPAPLHIALRIR